jgi:hypothetical protein
MSKIGENIYRCELCKTDHPVMPPFDREYINGVDIREYRTSGIKITPAEDNPIHICDECIDSIKKLGS